MDAGMMLRDSKLQLQTLPRHESRLLRPQNSSFDSKPQLGRTGKEEGKERGRDRRGRGNDRDDGSEDSKKRSETVIKDRARRARAWRGSWRESN